MIYRVNTPDSILVVRTFFVQAELDDEKVIQWARARVLRGLYKGLDFGGETEKDAFFALLAGVSKRARSLIGQPK